MGIGIRDKRSFEGIWPKAGGFIDLLNAAKHGYLPSHKLKTADSGQLG